MTWVPKTDFEEEIMIADPEGDFIYGALCEPEPQPFYPRPQSHLEYAAARKIMAKKQQEEYETTGRMNNQLQLIADVQRIACTKPLGELPSVNDWDTDKDVETETIALMRHFGMGPSLDEPLSEEVTLDKYPTQNGIEAMKCGSKTVPLLFNDDFFKLKPRVTTSPTASATASTSASASASTSASALASTSASASATATIPESCENQFGIFDTLASGPDRLQKYNILHNHKVDDDISNASASTSQYSFKTANDSSFSTGGISDSDESYLSTQPKDFVLSQKWYREQRRRSKKSSTSNAYSSAKTSLDAAYMYETNESATECQPMESFMKRYVFAKNDEDDGEKKKSVGKTKKPPVAAPTTYASVMKKPLDKTAEKRPTRDPLAFISPRAIYKNKMNL